ncbi:MAG TPA: hypothetical protein VFZ18_04050 [Longimicrobiaceae bacterium]
MADDYQVTRPGRAAIDSTASPRRSPPPISDNPEVARAQIEATRARMSDTIDEIEGAILRKKEELRAKLDVLAPVRERPLQAVGAIFGIGLALGLLTGGGDDDEDEATQVVLAVPVDDDDDEEFDEDDEEFDEDEDEEDDEAEEAWATAELWEDRAHRLLRIAKAQESELEMHRERQERALHERERPRFLGRREEREEEPDNVFERLREGAAEKLSGFISEITERMMRG